MKVVLIYRKRGAERHSIEELFHSIAIELSKKVEVIEYEAGDRRGMLVDAWRLRQLEADIYHVTGDINYLVTLLPRKKTVLTIHDIGHYMFGLSGIKRWIYKWLWLIIPIRKSGAVTSVSSETSKNIVKQLDVKDKHIEVIENCYSAIFEPVSKPFAEKRPVILQLGTKPYKNVPRLIEALKGLHCQLVLIGALDVITKKKLDSYGITYKNYVGITHKDIYQQYIECDLVTFISLHEGFGMPIIEAQAVGRPVITSNRSPMRDVAGRGACLVDPLSVVEIREAIQHIFADSSYRNKIIKEASVNVTRYSPAVISYKYLDLYKRLEFI